MLAAEQRLRRAADISAAVRTGDRGSRGGLVVHLHRGDAAADASARVGFVVPRAVGSAVTRNKVRRRLRHLLRDRMRTLPPGTDLVVRVLPTAAGETYKNLGIDLDAALGVARRRQNRPGRYRSADRPPSGRGVTVVTHDHVEEAGVTVGVPPATSLGARILSWPIIAYRRWISPALPPRCRFYPSCSEYALTAIAVHGPVRGVGLGIWRLLRCHPFHPGGIDHVPPPRNRRAARGAADHPTATT